jgi:endonuclease YncB( thermonuclease family)
VARAIAAVWRGIAAMFIGVLALIALLSGCRSAPQFSGQVVGVVDGDTLVVLDGRREQRVRLIGIDAPEGRQAYGSQSKQHLSRLAFGRTATVIVQGSDRYGRTLGQVLVDGVDVGLEQVRAGMAWHYVRYSTDPGIAKAELEARGGGRGIWAQHSPEPPWQFRRGLTARPRSRDLPSDSAPRGLK